MTRSRPIAVFDSGVGGLTVFRALRRRLPREALVYFGDTAHVPYGTKSPETVRRLAMTHLRFLARRRVKCAVVACNTVSAVALDGLRRAMAVPVIGVLGAGVRMALAATRTGRIGVIGTGTTIASGAYQRALLVAAPRRIRVLARACPLFVPLVEEGWAGHPVAERIAREYCAPLRRARVDTVILGCTHYPLLKPVLRRVFGSRVTLIDSAEAVEHEVEETLRASHLLRAGGPPGGRTFFLTDTGGAFRRVAERFLGEPLTRVIKVGVRIESVSDVAEGRG